MSNRSSIVRRILVTGALVTGVGVGAAGIAAAATGSSPSSSSSPGSSNSTAPAGSSNGAPPSGAPMNPATVTHGPNETLLTGTALQKADAAAKAAVPGATVIRAETDSSGASTYEVHMKKADGTYVTVELDANFNAVKTISGFGGGPAGGQAPGGLAPPSTSG
jgi:hypothetical protein